MKTIDLVKSSLVVFFATVLLWVAGTSANAEEQRTIFVDNFDFATSEVIFVDEDGFERRFPMGKWDATIGDEYTLVIPGENEPCYIKELIGLE